MPTQDAARNPTILVLNSGSSSLKFGLFTHSGDDETLLLEGAAEAPDSPPASAEGALLVELVTTVWRGAGPGGCQFLGQGGDQTPGGGEDREGPAAAWQRDARD